MNEEFKTVKIKPLPAVDCPIHGVHSHIITSTILGHEGAWCQICWLESLGEPLPLCEDVE